MPTGWSYDANPSPIRTGAALRLQSGPAPGYRHRLHKPHSRYPAQLDKIATNRECANVLSIIPRVKDGGGICCESGKILSDGQSALDDVTRKERLQRYRRGALAVPDEPRRNLEYFTVNGFKEMSRLEEIRDPEERLVVDQDGAEQGLLQLDIIRQRCAGAWSPIGEAPTCVELRFAGKACCR